MAEIVVGVDGSPAAQDALAWALSQGAATDATVRVVHVATPRSTSQREVEAPPSAKEARERAERLLDDAIAAAGADAGAKVIPEVVSGFEQSVPGVLLEYGRHADLLVVGSRGLGGFYGLMLGSVSQQLVQHAPCPVVVIPTPEGRL